MEPKLSIWTYDLDDGDYFIATSAEEAERFCADHHMETVADWRRIYEHPLSEWVMWPEDKPFTYVDTNKEDESGSHPKTTALPAHFIATHPRGYFASANW